MMGMTQHGGKSHSSGLQHGGRALGRLVTLIIGEWLEVQISKLRDVFSKTATNVMRTARSG